jgi:hypothetical protein
MNGYQFRGIVNNLTFGRNKLPSITVDGVIYKYMPVEFFKDKIEVGDSLIKDKNSESMLLIKKQTNEKIELKFSDATGYVTYE